MMGIRILAATGLALSFVGVTHVECTFRAAIVGNFGKRGSYRAKAAKTLGELAKTTPISAIISTGANFKGGVRSPTDENVKDGYDALFTGEGDELKVPFYNVMGQEDWSGSINALVQRSDMDFESANDAKHHTSLLTMPNWWYHHTFRFTTSEGIPLLGSQSKSISVGMFMQDSFVSSNAFPDSTLSSTAQKDFDTFLGISPRVFDYSIVVMGRKTRSIHDSRAPSALETKLEAAEVDLVLMGGSPRMEYFEFRGVLYVQCNVFANYECCKGSAVVKDDGEELGFSAKHGGFCLLEIDQNALTVKFIDGESGKVVQQVTRDRRTKTTRDQLSPYTLFTQLPEVKFYPIREYSAILGSKVDFVTVVGTMGFVVTIAFIILSMCTFGSKMIE